MDIREQDKFTHRQFIEAMLRDLNAVYPRKAYTDRQTHATIMLREGEQNVIDYLRRTLT